MSRKSGAESHNGLNDVIGIALLAAALLLLVSQLSFDHNDLSFYLTPHNEPLHNWGYKAGAYLAWFSFIPLGVAAYLLPLVLATFGLAYLLNVFGFLRERLKWSLLWTAVTA